MKVKGINKCYEVEIRNSDENVDVMLRDLAFNMMAVRISKENWKKIVKSIK